MALKRRTDRIDFSVWWAAIKPPIYSVAIVPITVGSAIAFAETNAFNFRVFATFLAAAVLIVAWLNLSNDVFDAETGVDRNKKTSVVNITGRKSVVFWVSQACLILALLGLAAIAWWLRDLTVLGLVLLACSLGYSYQGPPFRLGYRGWGEPICFVCFGPIAIAAAYYAQAQAFSSAAWAASTVIGLTTTIILFCSHFHQVEDDQRAGKRSPIVRLGTARGAQVLGGLTAGVFALVAVFVAVGLFPPSALLAGGSLPFAAGLVRYVRRYHHRPERVRSCKFIAVKFHFWSGMLLSLGFAGLVWA
ncbi:MAG: 2-carboxy-1,4-naphthoquinone phytyltransferase [Cyanobacteria bacterium QS_8_64_29]|nr:MAG: 2-carboxy-1,4-naphthoquinone phytyltransferase [Cyanobacteria bacterium QS_8_64_29]